VPWTRSFDVFTEATQAAHSFEQLKELLLSVLFSYDWDQINFTVQQDDELPIKHTGWGIITTYTQPWLDQYAAENCCDFDPVARCAVANAPPFKWKDLELTLPLSTKQLKLMRRAEGEGMHNGIGIPFPGPPPQRGGIALATSTRRLAKATNVDLIAAYCTQFYKSYKRVNGATRPEWPSMCTLTPKENEIMLMVLYQRSNREIAISMNTRPDTVAKSLQVICRKLGASGRFDAARKCERFGLLR
jgi:DNA-binding CsgD family transcriptional regulator